MSFIELLVSGAIVVMIFLGTMSLMEGNKSGLNNVKLQGEAFSIIAELRNFLSVPAQCQANFAGLTLSASPQAANGNRIMDSSSNVVFAIGTARAGESVKLTEATISQLTPFDSTITPPQGSTQFRASVQFPDGHVSSWTVPMYVQVDATGVVQQCSVGAWQKPLWDASSGALDYPNGNVGIGVDADATDALRIQGGVAMTTSTGSPFWGISMALQQLGNSMRFYSPAPGMHIGLMSPTGLFFVNYAPEGTYTGYSVGSVNNHMAFSVIQSSQNVIGFEGADPTRTWGLKMPTTATPMAGDATPNGVRFVPSQPSQAFIFQSRLVIGDTDGGTDLYTDGPAGGTTAWAVASDARLKRNVEDLPETLGFLRKIQGVRFQFRDSKKKSIGFIAQELEKVLPGKFQALVNRKGRFRMVRYSEMIPVLTESLQELLNKSQSLLQDQNEIIAAVCRKYPTDEACLGRTR